MKLLQPTFEDKYRVLQFLVEVEVEVYKGNSSMGQSFSRFS